MITLDRQDGSTVLVNPAAVAYVRRGDVTPLGNDSSFIGIIGSPTELPVLGSVADINTLLSAPQAKPPRVAKAPRRQSSQGSAARRSAPAGSAPQNARKAPVRQPL